MKAEFRQRANGVIDIYLGDRWRALEETLQDALTTRAPQGSDGANPSTYWIDSTLAAPGSMTDLTSRGDGLDVHSPYDLFDDQPVRWTELVDLLERWRTVVLDGPRSPPPVPSPQQLTSSPLAGLSAVDAGKGPVKSPRP